MENNPTWLPVVALALVDSAERWLLHRRPANKRHGGLWEFPGGKVEPGETPANALVREIGEELGIGIDPHSLEPAHFAQENGARPIVILLYTSGVWDGEPRALEGGEVDWFSPAEALSLDRPPLDVELMRRLVHTG